MPNIQVCYTPSRTDILSLGMSIDADLGLSLLMTDRINRSGSSSKIAEVEEKTAPFFRLGVQKKF